MIVMLMMIIMMMMMIMMIICSVWLPCTRRQSLSQYFVEVLGPFGVGSGREEWGGERPPKGHPNTIRQASSFATA